MLAAYCDGDNMQEAIGWTPTYHMDHHEGPPTFGALIVTQTSQ